MEFLIPGDALLFFLIGTPEPTLGYSFHLGNEAEKSLRILWDHAGSDPPIMTTFMESML